MSARRGSSAVWDVGSVLSAWVPPAGCSALVIVWASSAGLLWRPSCRGVLPGCPSCRAARAARAAGWLDPRLCLLAVPSCHIARAGASDWSARPLLQHARTINQPAGRCTQRRPLNYDCKPLQCVAGRAGAMAATPPPPRRRAAPLPAHPAPPRTAAGSVQRHQLSSVDATTIIDNY